MSLFEGLSFTNFLIVVESQNLRMHIEEKSIPTCWACLHARDHVQTFYFILVESCESKARYHLGGLANFSYEHTFFI